MAAIKAQQCGEKHGLSSAASGSFCVARTIADLESEDVVESIMSLKGAVSFDDSGADMEVRSNAEAVSCLELLTGQAGTVLIIAGTNASGYG